MVSGTQTAQLQNEQSDQIEQEIEQQVEQHRASKRKALYARADVVISKQQVLPGHTIDISSGGIGLLSPLQLNSGQKVTVRLALVVCGTEHEIEITGCVRFCLPIDALQFRVGLQFVHLDNDTAAFIKAVCA